MKRITEKVRKGNILISDGAWGTFLQKNGLKSGECPDMWCITRPDVVAMIAKSYVDAGADMIETNSFGANRFKLEHFRLQDKAGEINEAAASISRKAAGDKVYVIASVGPTGKMLLMGDVAEEEIYDAFKEQAVSLEKGGANAVCIETFSAIDEAVLAVRAAKENTRLEAICTFTFEKTVNGSFRTMMGVSPADMTNALIEAGADIVGTNCGNGMVNMAEIVKEIRKTSKDVPILVHANAGMPKNVNGVDVFPESPEQMAKNSVSVVEAGANIIGGCCGTTPEHIKAIANTLRRRTK